jgi:hypothetical protein
MESTIDFLRFRLGDREAFIAFSPLDTQGASSKRMLSLPGDDCQTHSRRLVRLCRSAWRQGSALSWRIKILRRLRRNPGSGGVASIENDLYPESRRLSAMCCGKAANTNRRLGLNAHTSVRPRFNQGRMKVQDSTEAFTA